MTEIATPEIIISFDQSAVEAINRLELEADIPETEASGVRWQQAEKVVEALESGLTQQQVADGWRRVDGTTYSQAHVSWTAKTWRVYNYSDNRPRWYDAYNSDEVRKSAHVKHNSGEDEWYTPAAYITAAVAAMGSIDLDPASTEEANEVVNATEIFTVGDDGLREAWFGNVWMNPPYAQPLVGLFADKLVEELDAERVEQACVLVNNATETKWFQTLSSVSMAVCFPAGRVKFWHPDRVSAPLQGQAVLYAGPHIDRFRREFGFGFTVTL